MPILAQDPNRKDGNGSQALNQAQIQSYLGDFFMAQKVERNKKMVRRKADDHWAFLVLLLFFKAFNAFRICFLDSILIYFSYSFCWFMKAVGFTFSIFLF